MCPLLFATLFVYSSVLHGLLPPRGCERVSGVCGQNCAVVLPMCCSTVCVSCLRARAHKHVRIGVVAFACGCARPIVLFVCNRRSRSRCHHHRFHCQGLSLRRDGFAFVKWWASISAICGSTIEELVFSASAFDSFEAHKFAR